MITNLVNSDVTKEFLVFVILAVIRTAIVDVWWWKLLLDWMIKNPWTWKYGEVFNINVYANSHAIMFVVSSVLSYILNGYITFSDPESTNNITSFIRFFAVNITTLILSVVFINFLTTPTIQNTIFSIYFLPLKELFIKHWALIAKLITICVIMVVNYASYRLFVF